jgi:hypothetical protein
MSREIGFQLFPPLTTVYDLETCESFIRQLNACLVEKSVLSRDRLTFNIPGQPYWIRDGLLFRRIVMMREARTEAVGFEILQRAVTTFPGRAELPREFRPVSSEKSPTFRL